MGGFSDVCSVTLLCLNLNSDDCETYYNSVVSCVSIMEFSVFFSSDKKRTECTISPCPRTSGKWTDRAFLGPILVPIV